MGAVRGARCACLSSTMKVATPSFFSRSSSTHCWAAAVSATTMKSRPPQAVEMATSYAGSMLPREPSRPMRPGMAPLRLARISSRSCTSRELAPDRAAEPSSSRIAAARRSLVSRASSASSSRSRASICASASCRAAAADASASCSDWLRATASSCARRFASAASTAALAAAVLSVSICASPRASCSSDTAAVIA
eukprot:scaffold7006_cov108-Isochrysis_galbana.AAC.6